MNIEVCRAFDLFEIILLIVLSIALIPLLYYLIKEIKRRHKARTTWQGKSHDILLYLIGVIIGVITNFVLIFSYHYIKSMFC